MKLKNTRLKMVALLAICFLGAAATLADSALAGTTGTLEPSLIEDDPMHGPCEVPDWPENLNFGFVDQSFQMSWSDTPWSTLTLLQEVMSGFRQWDRLQTKHGAKYRTIQSTSALPRNVIVRSVDSGDNKVSCNLTSNDQRVVIYLRADLMQANDDRMGLLNIAAHELGHLLGMWHTGPNDSLAVDDIGDAPIMTCGDGVGGNGADLAMTVDDWAALNYAASGEAEHMSNGGFEGFQTGSPDPSYGWLLTTTGSGEALVQGFGAETGDNRLKFKPGSISNSFSYAVNLDSYDPPNQPPTYQKKIKAGVRFKHESSSVKRSVYMDLDRRWVAYTGTASCYPSGKDEAGTRNVGLYTTVNGVKKKPGPNWGPLNSSAWTITGGAKDWSIQVHSRVRAAYANGPLVPVYFDNARLIVQDI